MAFKTNLVSFRTPTDKHPLVFATPSKNGLRISEVGALKIGIDYDLVADKDKGQFVAIGTVLVDGEVRLAITKSNENSSGYAKLGKSGKTVEGSLVFGGAAMYDALGGDEASNKVYSILEPTLTDEDGNASIITEEDAKDEEDIFWLLAYKEDRPSARGKGNKEEEEEEEAAGAMGRESENLV